MFKIYIETSVLLRMAKDNSILPEIREHDIYISDLVVAEVHNLNEPWRQWCAKFLDAHSIPVIRMDEEAIKLARRYVYNKVIDIKDVALGLHYALAVEKGIEKIVTSEERFASLFEGFKKINDVIGKPSPMIEKLELEVDENKLSDIRGMIARLLEAQGDVKLYRAIIDSVEQYQKEKKISLKRVVKV